MTELCARCSHWLQFCLEAYREETWKGGDEQATHKDGRDVKCHLGCCEFFLEIVPEGTKDVRITSLKPWDNYGFVCTSHRTELEWLHIYKSCCICAKLGLQRIWELERSRGDHDGAQQSLSEKLIVFRCGPVLDHEGRFLALASAQDALELRINDLNWLPASSLEATCLEALTIDANKQQKSQSLDAIDIDAKQNLDERRISIIKEWISECHGHAECNKTAPKRFYPSRLIYLSEAEDDKKYMPRLISQYDAFDGDIVYATLSHCWGGKVFTTLTRQNLEAFHVRIPTENLSKTFADAIHLCWRLNIKLLWIDSLCIIQDDKTDWAVESSRMHDVYRFAFLNLAASGSWNGLGGLFRPFRPHALFPVKINSELKSGEQISLQDQGCLVEDLDRENDAILWQRGWVAQEKFFSRRQVVFGTNQMFWVCLSRRDLECSRHTTPLHDDLVEWCRGQKRHLGAGDNSQITAGYLDRIGRLLIESSEELDQCWYDICKDYSDTDVTVATDKPIAFSGMAKAFEKIYSNKNLHTKYLAGLWQHDMVNGLLWQRRKDFPRPRHYDFTPSWSWISLGSSVDFWKIRSSDELLITLEEINVAPSDFDLPYGPCSGSIFLYGSLIANGLEVEAEQPKGSAKLQFLVNTFKYRKPLWGASAIYARIGETQSREDKPKVYVRASLYLDWPLDGSQQDTKLNERLSKSYLLLVGREKPGASNETCYYGLVVEEDQRQNSKGTRFRRFGAWKSNTPLSSQSADRIGISFDELRKATIDLSTRIADLSRDSRRKIELT